MASNFFSILVPYNDSMVIATAVALEDPLQLRYQVTFPDGYTNVFHTNQTGKEAGWAEATLDATELAHDVGTAIELYREKEYLEPFSIRVEGNLYFIQPFTEDQGLSIKYKTFSKSGKHLADVFLNEYGEWQEDLITLNAFSVYTHLALEIGKAIENAQY